MFVQLYSLVLFDIVLVILILYSATPFPPSLKGILFYIQVRPVYIHLIDVTNSGTQAMSYAATSFPLSTWRGSQLVC